MFFHLKPSNHYMPLDLWDTNPPSLLYISSFIKEKKKYYKKVSINKAYKNIHKMSLIMIFSTDEHKRYKVQTC